MRSGFFLMVISVFLTTIGLYGQDEKRSPFFWGSLGTGVCGVQNEHYQLAAGGSGNIVLKNQLFGFRILRNKEFAIFKTPHQVNEFALYWGKYCLGLNGDTYISTAIGPAVETYYTYGAVHPSTYNNPLGTYHYLIANNVFGIAFDAQAGFNFGRFFSLGIHGFANVNAEKMIGGMLFDLRIGYLRKKLNVPSTWVSNCRPLKKRGCL